jgi:signal transduction histidine kinase
MRSLFWKGMLTFLAIILVAVGTVALLSGWATVVEFRRYTLTQEGRWERQMTALTAYYAEHGSWEGVQENLSIIQSSQGRGRGGEDSGGRGGQGPPALDFRLADQDGWIVADTGASPDGRVTQDELESGIPVEVEGRVVGYLLFSPQATAQAPIALDSNQSQFLARVRTSVWVAALSATVAALVAGGLLFRSIVAPLRRLTTASQAIAGGDLSVRAPVRGRDEVARLASAFNQMAESLARAEQARRNQTADIAHELRTPLTVLRGTIDAMLDGIYATDRENLLSAQAQVGTLTRLVEDLRLLALNDAGQLRLDVAPLDMAVFLREVVDSHQIQAQERGVSLTLEAPPSLSGVRADRDRLAQVMGNLLGNALRYVSRGGRIDVRVKEQGQEIIVSLTDDGPGIPSEDLPYLFERFWRGDQARRQATGGSGLGLTIARSLIEAHGGRIWAHSIEGEGSTFAFALPVVTE